MLLRGLFVALLLLLLTSQAHACCSAGAASALLPAAAAGVLCAVPAAAGAGVAVSGCGIGCTCSTARCGAQAASNCCASADWLSSWACSDSWKQRLCKQTTHTGQTISIVRKHREEAVCVAPQVQTIVDLKTAGKIEPAQQSDVLQCALTLAAASWTLPLPCASLHPSWTACESWAQQPALPLQCSGCCPAAGQTHHMAAAQQED